MGKATAMIKYLALILSVQCYLGVAGQAFGQTPKPSNVFHETQAGAGAGAEAVRPIQAAQDPLSPPKKNLRTPLDGSQDPSKQVLMAILGAVSQKKISVSPHSASKMGGMPPIGSQ